MRICINALLVSPGKTGGGETFLLNVVRGLHTVDKDNEYLVLVTEENRRLFETVAPNFNFQSVFKSSRSPYARILFENLILPFYLLKKKVDLLYSPFGTLPLLLFCKSVVSFQNVIYIGFRENVPFRGKSLKSRLRTLLQAAYYSLMTPWMLKSADKVWVVSHTTAELLRKKYRIAEDKLEVIWSGVDLARFNRSCREEDSSLPYDFPYIITVATLYPNKNIDKIISSFASVVQKGFDHRLVIVGPDWNNCRAQLELQAVQLGLRDRVIFTGAVDHNLVPQYFWGADLFLLMSNVEAFPLPILEAMAAGVPVIVSDKSSLPEVAGEAAISVTPEKRDLLSDQMIKVLSDKQISARMRLMGLNRARRFDWNETAVRALDLFYEAAGTKPLIKIVENRTETHQDELKGAMEESYELTSKLP